MVFKVGNVEVLLMPATPLDHPLAHYDGLNPGKTLLKRGHKSDPERAAFQADTILESDVEVRMRDGVVLRADIYRPAASETLTPTSTPLPSNANQSSLAAAQVHRRYTAMHELSALRRRVCLDAHQQARWHEA
ncbi:uncharacterized protein F5Z01DRAFT_634097 [Emericellopsis atlantica]|uniref:Uncharacterized protein n=1 Tax=Emericellopsis atlantica TaxID=2614577 RepID=A0A9P8CR08_9HYPO|nr:uncharacterized protein F5Z01DRAFT_634097 [Emericellopsis atlantica]KAG9256514.1 hypothetical protein F5Z01DRAFT_634097 [Emericellopsis atlantica]